jgi:hypothetical protein
MAAALCLPACTSSIGGPVVPDGGTAEPRDGGPVWFDGGEIEEATCEPPAGVSAGKLVRAVYLVPSDREVDPRHLANIGHALADAQLWLRARLPRGTSFLVHQPIDVVETDHPESYYRTSGEGSTYDFWWSGIDDAFALTGADYEDPDTVWLFFLAAAPTCSQATGAVDRVALFSSRELARLSGQAPLCPGDQEGGRCRAVGGVTLRILHALGVPDPAACLDEEEETDCPLELLTELGHNEYPAAELHKDQIEFLGASGFADATGLPTCQLACAEPLQP